MRKGTDAKLLGAAGNQGVGLHDQRQGSTVALWDSQIATDPQRSVMASLPPTAEEAGRG